MKTYIGKRDGETTVDPTLVMVRDEDENGIRHYGALPHHVRHSPGCTRSQDELAYRKASVHHLCSGAFNWGYSGSGPAELARCILIDYLGTTRVSGGLYQEFKARMIASLAQGQGWEITEAQIVGFLMSPYAQTIQGWLEDDLLARQADEEIDIDAWIERQERENHDLKARYRGDRHHGQAGLVRS